MRYLWTSLLFFIVYGRFDSIWAKKWKCGFPGTPAYGYVKPDNGAYSLGDVVTYTCRVGYILLGAPISKCTDDGSWSEVVPICDDSMTTLSVAFSTPTLPGYSAELGIDKNKDTCSYLKPKKPRWWRIDLGKEHNVLSVAITMIPDRNVKFTVYVVKIEEKQNEASYKSCAYFNGKFETQTILLSCAKGKGTVGQSVHIEDHLQTDGFFEICEVEVQVEKDAGYDCGRPSRSLYSINYEPENEMIEYECMKGYELKGNLFRNCLNTGQWSGNPPVCEPIYCDDMDPLENGEIQLSHGNSGPPLEGAVVIYKCNEGYRLEGPFTRNCLKDGSWSEKPPQCKAIRCPIPEGKDLGGVYRLVNKTNSMGSMAILRCKGGKREGDNPYIVCTEEGEWTKPEVRCILPARAAYEIEDRPRIVNKEAIIFGMVVAAIMIVVVLVAIYLYGKRRTENKPELPSRLFEPPAPPPRPPPRTKVIGFKNAFLGLMSRDSIDSQGERKTHSLPKGSPPTEDAIGWKTLSLPLKAQDEVLNQVHGQGGTLPEDKDAVVEVEVMPHDYSDSGKRNLMYDSLPEENEDASPEDVIIDIDQKANTGSSPSEPKSSDDYAAVDYEKKRQSRQLKEHDSLDSTSGSPLPSDDPERKESTTLPKKVSPSETEESESEEENSQTEVKPQKGEEKRAVEEEERRAKEKEEREAREEEERKTKEEEERKAKEEEERKAKEEEEKKKAEIPRRRRTREEPPAPVIEKPVLRRVRKF